MSDIGEKIKKAWQPKKPENPLTKKNTQELKAKHKKTMESFGLHIK